MYWYLLASYKLKERELEQEQQESRLSFPPLLLLGLDAKLLIQPLLGSHHLWDTGMG